ncbi:AraC family transcriptional regulator [Aquimarina sp. BL5]|uniref:AraC family transcriptional regulator n=1 Tax=Aquimarina sp. BL5 TaxID=1714860 RepID=UPI000E500E62|nr:AraC family transcriptional regulator [Aquimarina sp. BL5]AXT51299.1 AraC family transcriptional regulator [Aquimarina sp. BL5]RKM95632.1 helix-turn-helix domain-containing protein [Aquimarina sp. BL5]
MKAQLKQVTTSPNNSFKVKRFEEKEFKAEWHFHPQYELTYIIQSTGIRYVGDSMQSFERGDLVLVGKNVPHSWKTIDAKNEQVKCVVIQWDEDLFKYWIDKPEFISIKNMLLKSSYGISFDLETALSLEKSFSSIFNQNPFDRFLNLLNILNILATKASMKLLAGPSFGKDLSLKESHRVNVINNYIKDNYQNEPSLTELSNMLSLSKEAFCRFFKKTFDKTYSNYVNEYKITIASKMLIETDLSVSEVGYESGFNNLSFFHRKFNKYKQMSPNTYRQIYQRI